MINVRDIVVYEIDGVDWSDYPKFCEIFITKAQLKDGRFLTEEELELYNDKIVEHFHNNIMSDIHETAIDRAMDYYD